MKDIFELILQEFIGANYDIIEHKKDYGTILKHLKHEDYWIVMDNFQIEQQKAYFETCRTIVGADPASLKNISLLGVKKVNVIDVAEKQWCIDIENDPFFFKKYGLVYTEDSWLELNDLLKDKQDKSISSVIMNPELFNQCKKSGNDNFITLMYSIAHKLPFLMIETKPMALEVSLDYGLDEILENGCGWLEQLEIGNIEKYINDDLNRIKNEYIDR